MKKRKKLGEILVGWNVLDPAALSNGLQYAQQHGKRIGESLVELELCSEDDVVKALATQFGLEYIDMDRNQIDKSILELMPAKLMADHYVIPVSEEGGRLKVIFTDPLDLEAQDLVRFRMNRDIVPVLAPRSKVKFFIDKFVNAGDDLSKSMKSISASLDYSEEEKAAQTGGSAIVASDADAPIIKLVNLIITTAVHNRASDIHIEPYANRIRVRYRIDGVCHIQDDIPKVNQSAVIARLKIMSGIDIAEKRIPQDGRIKMKIGGNPIDFRVASCPSYHGESIVMRILRPDAVKIGVQALGFEEDTYETFYRTIRRPNGVFLVTGPTGSGKTTTLYAALQELNRPDVKIITAEDPVEYNFTGMNQVQVKEDIGLTFARILRAMLRQAPNVILVGEIRDKEVGEVAIQAALTGHLVFSTLHTNDAPSAITRLIDMGIKPFLVASAIQAIMAQRLARIICEECRIVDTNPERQVLKMLGFTEDQIDTSKFYKGEGCKRCGGEGVRGRKGIFEFVTMNNQMRELAFEMATASRLRAAARASGMRTLLEDGKLKVLKGMIAPAELLRITQAEGIVDQE